MTETRKLAGDTEASRDATREAQKLSPDTERAAARKDKDAGDLAERRRADALASASGQTGST